MTQTSTEVTPTETDSGKAISTDLEVNIDWTAEYAQREVIVMTIPCGWCMTNYHIDCRGDLFADNGKVYQCGCPCETAISIRGRGDRNYRPTNSTNGGARKRTNTRKK